MNLRSLFILLAFICCFKFAKAQTVAVSDCAQQHSGDFCFRNSSKNAIQFNVLYCYMPVGSQYPSYKSTRISFSLQPGESKNINGVMVSPGVRNNFVAKVGNTVVDEGDFITEECEMRTHEIK